MDGMVKPPDFEPENAHQYAFIMTFTVFYTRCDYVVGNFW